ncbi:MAG: exosome complex RNA-binding protein Csl4 [Candidatus Diapherotrites archaeon]|uniref:Exosome complex component Csl4 n=1 Tax=Candidatus Iainarchaeum sp. TaxID=3101447 RepID=A0A938YY28_9ARCH|nr:exosome complex RNA-binding protein Csl4 [Candidatus Diapherotrites archaeon]
MEKKRVLPGEQLSTEEEFEPGPNTYADDGNVYSASLGTVSVDSRHKSIDVESDRKLNTLKPGTVVYGSVFLVKESSVIVSLRQCPDKEDRRVISQGNAMLPVRNVSRDYVKSLRDNFRIGDLVKAKVSRASPLGIDLSTVDNDLGVIKAFCSKCRKPLHLFGHSLRCLSCGSREQRKLSSEYLLK